MGQRADMMGTVPNGTRVYGAELRSKISRTDRINDLDKALKLFNRTTPIQGGRLPTRIGLDG